MYDKELFEKNLKAIGEANLKPLLDGIDETTIKKNKITLEDGDFNLTEDGHHIFINGAKKDAEIICNAVIKHPARILFGKPNMMFIDAHPSQPNNENSSSSEIEEVNIHEEEYLTKKYDDVSGDKHVGIFMKKISKTLEDLALKVTEKIQKENPYYLVSFGVGIGYHIETLFEKYKPKSIYILECDREMLWHSFNNYDWEPLIKKIKANGSKLNLIVEENEKNLLGKLNGSVQLETIIGLDTLTSVKISNHPKLNLVYSEFNSSKTSNLASYMGYTVDEYNMMKNSFRNLKTGNRRLLNKVRIKPKLPVVIVGSGPSLEKNIDFIKKVREKVILISSGSSFAVLLKNGIYPDFQAVLERAKGNFDRHTELSKEYDLKRVVAILTTTIWPGSADYFKDSIFFLRPALSPLAVWCQNESEVLQGEGPQVTNTAFAFATRLEFKEIYLLGVDLGARDPARPRAENAWLTPGVEQRKLNIPVRGNFGRTVFTDNPLIQQRQTIENQILKIKKKEGKVINLGDGVLIAGAEARRCEDVDLPQPDVENLQAHIKELVEQFPKMSRERFLSDWESSQVRLSVANMTRSLKKAFEDEKKWSHNLIKKIDDINQYVNKPVKQQYAPRLLRGTIIRMSMYLQSLFNRTPADKEEIILERIKPIWYETMDLLEKEAYDLADELESEDEQFARDMDKIIIQSDQI